MKVINLNDVGVYDATIEPNFTGGQVNLQFIINEKIAKEVNIGLAKFGPGGRIVYHTHTAEQILYVTEGKGIVATEDEEVTLTPGMVVFIPPGEKHWHGATKDSSFTHIVIYGQANPQTTFLHENKS